MKTIIPFAISLLVALATFVIVSLSRPEHAIPLGTHTTLFYEDGQYGLAVDHSPAYGPSKEMRDEGYYGGTVEATNVLAYGDLAEIVYGTVGTPGGIEWFFVNASIAADADVHRFADESSWRNALREIGVNHPELIEPSMFQAEWRTLDFRFAAMAAIGMLGVTYVVIRSLRRSAETNGKGATAH